MAAIFTKRGSGAWRGRALLALCAVPLIGAAPGAPIYPPFGLDLTARDVGVRPGDDFFDYANGAYLKRAVIPADRTTVSRRYEMTDRMEANLHTLLDDAAKTAAPEATTTRDKVGAFYAAALDEALAERLGAAPLKPEMDAIGAAADRAALARLMGQGTSGLYPSLFSIASDVDLKAPDRYAIYLGQAGLGLPDRDYYLTPALAPQKQAYRAYAARLLTLIGWPDAEAAATAIVTFETHIAEASWTKVEQRDITKLYNPLAPRELAGLAPGFDWAAFLDQAGLGARPVLVVAEKTAFPKIAAVYAATPVETLKAWMAFRVADSAAPYLSKAFVDTHFDFRLKTLTGQQQPQPRWKRAMRMVSGGDCGADPTSCFGT
ncbi:MAG: hypothetical protein ACRCSO_04700, partial [Sphingomonas sp.]